MVALKPIENTTIVERIVKQITNAITSGELKPGDKIPTEIELMESLGVGRNSLREAIKMLSALGVLKIRRGDGTYIAEKVSPSAFDALVYSLVMEQSTTQEMLELRQRLEIDILELAAQKATSEDIKKLEWLLDQFHSAFARGDFENAAQLDLQFHYMLVDTARNPLLGRIVKGVLDLFQPSVKRTLEQYEAPKGNIHQSHIKMVEAIKNRQTNHITQIVKESLQGWKDYVKE